jgi:hypothetical protein
MGYLDAVAPGQGEATLQEAIRRTAHQLEVEPDSRAAFEEAARESVLEMEQALAVRERELACLVPRGDGRLEESEASRRSAERYAAARERALLRIEKFLGEGPNPQAFRWGFDSWASLVAAKARGAGR